MTVQQLFQELEQNWSDRAADWDVTLAFNSDPELPGLIADRRRLLQALDCILENALSYTGAGGRVAVSSLIGADGAPIFVIEDTGPGMTGPDLDSALAPFGRVAVSAAHSRPGAGLGINLAAGIMALHQGTTSISSIPGEGT
jgi:signal transduction histidine kinase